jgi:hypothetical protein
MIKTTSTRTTYDVSGQIQVKNAIRILRVSHTSGEVKEVINGNDQVFDGIIEMIVAYYEIRPDGTEFEISGRNDLDNRIVRALELRDNYIFGLDQSLFSGLVGYERMEKTAYYFLKKHWIEKAIFGITDENELQILF